MAQYAVARFPRSERTLLPTREITSGEMPTLNPDSSVRPARRNPTRGLASKPGAVATIALLTLMAAPASPAHAEPTKKPVSVTISSKVTWTHTHVTVKKGETVTIKASGAIHFGAFPLDRMGPDGKPPAACKTLAQTQGAFTAPTLNCWSLIGMIGTEAPVPVGAQTSFSATSNGELLLGVNDNRRQDNTGSWQATISVSAASGSGPAPTGGSSSKSNGLLFVLIGIVILLALLALFFLARRRRGNGEPVAAAPPDAPPDVILAEVAPPVPVPAAVILDEPIDQPAEESVGSFAKAPGPLGTSVAPVEGEVVDVNIFEVEIANGTDLRVGYNYFPEDTDLHWQVRQGSLFAHGQFPTNGGGNMYHYVTLPLGVHLEPAPAAVDVQFTWALGGVPFRYSVRRDPGI